MGKDKGIIKMNYGKRETKIERIKMEIVHYFHYFTVQKLLSPFCIIKGLFRQILNILTENEKGWRWRRWLKCARFSGLKRKQKGLFEEMKNKF